MNSLHWNGRCQLYQSVNWSCWIIILSTSNNSYDSFEGEDSFEIFHISTASCGNDIFVWSLEYLGYDVCHEIFCCTELLTQRSAFHYNGIHGRISKNRQIFCFVIYLKFCEFWPNKNQPKNWEFIGFEISVLVIFRNFGKRTVFVKVVTWISLEYFTGK